MLHPSHTWATWPSPGLWTACSALQGWATAAQGWQGHTGAFCGAGRDILWGRQQCRQSVPIPTQLWSEQEPAAPLYADTQRSQRQEGYVRCQLSKRLRSDKTENPHPDKKRPAILSPCSAEVWHWPSVQLHMGAYQSWTGEVQRAEPIIWVWHSCPCCSPLQFTQFRHSQARFWWQLQS